MSNSKWISVNDELPPIGELVVLRIGSRVFFGKRTYSPGCSYSEWAWATACTLSDYHKGRWNSAVERTNVIPTHWHSLPDPSGVER